MDNEELILKMILEINEKITRIDENITKTDKKVTDISENCNIKELKREVKKLQKYSDLILDEIQKITNL